MTLRLTFGWLKLEISDAIINITTPPLPTSVEISETVESAILIFLQSIFIQHLVFQVFEKMTKRMKEYVSNELRIYHNFLDSIMINDKTLDQRNYMVDLKNLPKLILT